MQVPSVSLEVTHLFDRLCLQAASQQQPSGYQSGLRLKSLRNEPSECAHNVFQE